MDTLIDRLMGVFVAWILLMAIALITWLTFNLIFTPGFYHPSNCSTPTPQTQEYQQ